jgi:hypothetical protein
MGINWKKLEDAISQYLKEGSTDRFRTSEKTAKKIEELYIKEIVRNGKDAFGNRVIRLPSGVLSSILVVKFKANVGVIPTVNPTALAEAKFNSINKTPPLPRVGAAKPKGFALPTTTVSIQKPSLPGINRSMSMNIQIPSIPSKTNMENRIRSAMKLPLLPEQPAIPLLSISDLIKTVNPIKMPQIPSPGTVVAKVTNALPNAFSRRINMSPSLGFMVPKLQSPLPVPSLRELGISIPTLPVDSKLLQMNAVGMNGVILVWLGAKMGITSLPPGFGTVTTNTVVNPGAITIMKSKLGGPEVASEVVNALKLHANTVSGITVGTTPNGSPISLPWTGIS